MRSMKHRGKLLTFFVIVLLFAGVISTTVTGISKKINLGLDLQGGFEVLYEVEPVDKNLEVNQQLLESTVQALYNRVDRLGISEANIAIEGENQIRVQIAGVEDQSEAREILATSARLSFRDVNDVEHLDGSDIKEGSAKQDFSPETGLPIVTLELKDANKFGDVTERIARMAPQNLLVIWMDFEEGDSFFEEAAKDEPKFVSAPAVGQRLNTSRVEISGSFTVEEAKRLADIINAGSLPVNMEELYSTSVGAQFGEKALNQTIFAGFVGVALIFVYMIAVYRFPGVIASINMVIYVYLILLVFQLMNGVLTLPGIAALILGVGMAVDANVITFERIKEEIKTGKSIKAAFKAGRKNALGTILDANITTMIAAVVLFYFGTSSVKGFATMLIVSILLSFLTAVYGTRLLLGLWVNSGFLNKKPSWFAVKKEDIHDIADSTFREPTFMGKELNIVSHTKKVFTFSIATLVIGILSLLILKLNPGIDFTSGSRIEILSNQEIVYEEVEKELAELDLVPNTLLLSGENNEIAIARYDMILDKETIAEISSVFSAKYGNEPSVSVVSPIVGKKLVKDALYALLFAGIGLMIHISFRFEFFFGIATLVTILHDVFFMLVILSLTRIEFDVTIVAALLTIVGYTINNTIVIFDRIRENIRAEGAISSVIKLRAIVNRSLVQSITRSISTTVTTMLAVIAFLLLGAESITSFSIALLVGLIAGFYSSLFLAAQLWILWQRKRIKTKPIDFRKKERVEGPVV